MQFVAVDDSGHFSLSSECRDLLDKLSAPIRVVSIVGRYRSGKSSLLNHLVGQSCFSTSSTVQAHTKGIVGHVVRDGKSDDGTTIVLDTEGLGSVQVSKNHDASIFALAMTLSSGCLLNISNAITSSNIEDLHLASKVASLMASHGKLALAMPELLWVIRDFTLELKSQHGAHMTPTEYMEECLRNHGSTDAVAQLCTTFPNRSAFTMPRPADREEDIRQMRNVHPEFLASLDTLKQKAFAFPCKQRRAVPMDGRDLCAYMDSMCTALNTQDVVPNLDSVWEQIMVRAREHATQDAVAVFLEETSAATGFRMAWDVYSSHLLGETMSLAECQALCLELCKQDTRVPALTTRVCTLETSLAQERESLARAKREHVMQRAELESEVSEMKQALQAQTTDVLSLTETSRELRESLLRKDAQIDSLQADFQETTRGLQSELQSTLRALHDSQCAQRESLQSAEQLERLAKLRQVELEKMQLMHRQLLSQHEEQSTQLQEYTQQNHQLKTDVAVWTSRHGDVESRLNKRQKLADKKNIDTIQQQTEIQFLRERHKDMTERHAVLQKQLDELQRQNRLLAMKSQFSLPISTTT